MHLGEKSRCSDEDCRSRGSKHWQRRNFNKMPAIGIDLGTYYSCVAVFRNGRIEVIPNEIGCRVTPSVVSFNDHERLVGQRAKNLKLKNPENTLYEIRQIIGRKFNDDIVQDCMKKWDFNVVDENHPKLEVRFRERKKLLYPEEVSAMILDYLKECAEGYLGQKVTDAVITVPAYFNEAQRKATKDAGKIAGLNVIGMISEPTAAAIAYGLENQTSTNKTVLVFTLQKGTLDVTIIYIENNVFTLLAVGGDTHLGSEDFTDSLLRYFSSWFNRKHGVDITENARSVARLRNECNRVKKQLSTSTSDIVQVDALFEGLDFSMSITRDKFERLNFELFQKIIEAVKSTIKIVNVSKEKIDLIVLVGNGTKIPKIHEILEKHCGKKLLCTINPDEVVAYGAAVQAAILTGDLPPRKATDGVPKSAKTRTKSQHMSAKSYDNQASASAKIDDLVGESAIIPNVRELLEKNFKTDLLSAINPDEVEACGAALLEGGYSSQLIVNLVGGSTTIPNTRELLDQYCAENFLSFSSDKVLLGSDEIREAILTENISTMSEKAASHDVTPLSLGLNSGDSKMVVVIPRSSRIPVKRHHTVWTLYDNQTFLSIQVYEGERACAGDNRLLGTLDVSGFPPLPRGDVKFSVCFDIDRNGILTVTAGDKTTGKSEQIVIDKKKRNLNRDEIQRLIAEAEKFRLDDEEYRRRLDFINDLKNFINDAKKSIEKESARGRIKYNSEKDKVLNECMAMMEWLKVNEGTAEMGLLRYKKRCIEDICHPFLAKIYKSQ